jgi:hypothetical protein
MADAKQKRQMYVLVALLVTALLVWYYQFAKHPVSTGFSVENGTYTPINAQDFSGVLAQLSRAQSTEYKSTGRNIFIAGAVPAVSDPNTPKIVAPNPVKQIVGPQLPAPPPPPVLSAIFFGYGQLPSGGPRRAFLLDGDEVRIVGEGETVQTNLRITHIGNDSIEFEDINTHLRGSKPIEASPASPAV